MGASEGRILALDLGSRRIGIALSHDDVALPEGVLESRGRVKDLETLRRLVVERGVTQVVVGVPIHMSGRRGKEAERAEGFARDLAEATGLPVDLVDERWTSREAERALRATGHDARSARGRVDAVAASLLLRSYLDRRRSRG